MNDLDQLRTAHARVLRELKHARINAGALEAGDDNEDDNVQGNAGAWIDLNMVLEEVRDGGDGGLLLVVREAQKNIQGADLTGALYDGSC